jgi:hypothetical protein
VLPNTKFEMVGGVNPPLYLFNCGVNGGGGPRILLSKIPLEGAEFTLSNGVKHGRALPSASELTALHILFT